MKYQTISSGFSSIKLNANKRPYCSSSELTNGGIFFSNPAKKFNSIFLDISTDFRGSVSNIRERERNIRAKPETPRDRSSSYTDDHKALPSLVRRTTSRRDGSGANFNPDLRLRITRDLVPSCQRKKGGDEEQRETGEESWMGGKMGMKGYFERHGKFQLSFLNVLRILRKWKMV